MANWKKKLKKAGKKIGVGLTHEEKVAAFKKQKEELRLRTEVAKERAALAKYKRKGGVGIRLRTPEEQARMPSIAAVFGYEPMPKAKITPKVKRKKRRKKKHKRKKTSGRTFTISY